MKVPVMVIGKNSLYLRDCMVRVVRTPDMSRLYFSASDLSGWMEEIAYEPSSLVRRRKKKLSTPIMERTQPKPSKFKGGTNLLK